MDVLELERALLAVTCEVLATGKSMEGVQGLLSGE